MAARAGATRAKAAAIPQLSWNEIRPAPVVLVSGAETVLAERASTMLRDFLRSEDPALEVSDLEADGYRRGELLTLASPSLFGEPRLIRVTAVERASDDFLIDALEYLEQTADGTTLLLRHAGGQRRCRVRAGARRAPRRAARRSPRRRPRTRWSRRVRRSSGPRRPR